MEKASPETIPGLLSFEKQHQVLESYRQFPSLFVGSLKERKHNKNKFYEMKTEVEKSNHVLKLGINILSFQQ
jgi:hypothetical protein